MVIEYFGIKFVKEKFSAFTGETTISWCEQDAGDGMKIFVTPQGMRFEGTLSKMLTTTRDLNGYAKLIGDAWTAHLALAPKIVNVNGDAL